MRNLAPLVAILAAAVFNQAAFATIQTTAMWRVFPSQGSSTNGGGYDNGPTITSPGTDYSINQNKNAPACSNCGSSTINLSTTDAVAVGTGVITSATAAFTAAIVGNGVYFTGGTGAITAQRRTVITFTSATSITVDANIAASTGMTMNIGGALDTIPTAMTANVPGNAICVKSTGTITTTASITNNNNQNAQAFNKLWGYTTTCGDHGPVNITLSTNTGLTALDFSGNAGWWIDGVNIDCATLGTSTGVFLGAQSQLTNFKIANCTTRNYRGSSNTSVFYGEITGCTSACASAADISSNSVMKFVDLHDNAATAIIAGGANHVAFNIIDTVTGANHDGIQFDFPTTIENNDLYNVTRNCLNDTGSSGHINLGSAVHNNIMSTCATTGLLGAGVPIYASPAFDGNVYFNNGANRGNIDLAAGSVGMYTNVWDVICVTDPFTNAAGRDFTLTSTACGTAAKGTGQPGFVGPSWGKSTGTGFLDLGVFQTQFGTGGGTTNSGSVQ